VRPRIALLPWGDVIEDWLEPIGVSLERLRDEYTGGWLFGYIDALAATGVDTVLVCVSRRTRRVLRWTHAPTGAALVVLPQPLVHRALRLAFGQRYAWALGPYVATPVVRLARELRRHDVAAILCQEHEYARFDVCVALGRRLGIPVFATHQGGGTTPPGLEALVRPRSIRAAAGFVVAGAAEAERLEREHGVPASRIARIPNPVTHAGGGEADRDARRRALGFPPEAVVVAWHGRIDMHIKGLDVLLDAWAALPREPDRRLLLIGAGSDQEWLRERLPGDAVWIDRYLTDRAELAGLLAAADLYVLPSRREGFPVAPVEAMAGGLPVVASDVRGMAEILPRGEADGGVIVPSGDAAALANALAELIADAPRRTALAAAARRRSAEGFSAEAVGRALRSALLDR
jgi:starch synthase